MADKTTISLGKCEITSSFDPKYKTSMKPVMGEALKKGIEASGDFTTAKSGGEEGKSFMLNASVSIAKDEKSKPTKVKVTANCSGLLTGKGTSSQQFAGSATSSTETSSKIDEDVKMLVKDALQEITAKNGKMFTAMRNLL